MMVEYTHRHTHTYAKTENQGAAREKTEKKSLLKRYDHRETKNFFAKMRTFLGALDTHSPNLEVLVFSLSTT